MLNQNTGTAQAEDDVTAHSDPGTPITVGGDGGSATGTPITVGGDDDSDSESNSGSDSEQ